MEQARLLIEQAEALGELMDDLCFSSRSSTASGGTLHGDSYELAEHSSQEKATAASYDRASPHGHDLLLHRDIPRPQALRSGDRPLRSCEHRRWLAIWSRRRVAVLSIGRGPVVLGYPELRRTTLSVSAETHAEVDAATSARSSCMQRLRSSIR